MQVRGRHLLQNQRWTNWLQSVLWLCGQSMEEIHTNTKTNQKQVSQNQWRMENQSSVKGRCHVTVTTRQQTISSPSASSYRVHLARNWGTMADDNHRKEMNDVWADDNYWYDKTWREELTQFTAISINTGTVHTIRHLTAPCWIMISICKFNHVINLFLIELWSLFINLII